MPSPSTNWLDNASYFYVDLQFNSFYHTSLHLNLTTIQGVSRAVKVQAITEASWPSMPVLPGHRALRTGMCNVPVDRSDTFDVQQHLVLCGGRERAMLGFIFQSYCSHAHSRKDQCLPISPPSFWMWSSQSVRTHSFSQSFNNHLLRPYYIPGFTVMFLGCTKDDKTHEASALMELTF